MILPFSVLRKLINSSCPINNFRVQASLQKCVRTFIIFKNLFNVTIALSEFILSKLPKLCIISLEPNDRDTRDLKTIQSMVTVCNGVLQNLKVKALNSLKIYHCTSKDKILTYYFKIFLHYFSFMFLFDVFIKI